MIILLILFLGGTYCVLPTGYIEIKSFYSSFCTGDPSSIYYYAIDECIETYSGSFEYTLNSGYSYSKTYYTDDNCFSVDYLETVTADGSCESYEEVSYVYNLPDVPTDMECTGYYTSSLCSTSTLDYAYCTTSTSCYSNDEDCSTFSSYGYYSASGCENWDYYTGSGGSSYTSFLTGYLTYMIIGIVAVLATPFLFLCCIACIVISVVICCVIIAGGGLACLFGEGTKTKKTNTVVKKKKKKKKKLKVEMHGGDGGQGVIVQTQQVVTDFNPQQVVVQNPSSIDGFIMPQGQQMQVQPQYDTYKPQDQQGGVQQQVGQPILISQEYVTPQGVGQQQQFQMPPTQYLQQPQGGQQQGQQQVVTQVQYEQQQQGGTQVQYNQQQQPSVQYQPPVQVFPPSSVGGQNQNSQQQGGQQQPGAAVYTNSNKIDM